VLLGFVLTDPRLPGWLVASQEALVNGLTDRGRELKLKKLAAEIETVEAEYRKLRIAQAKAEAEERIEAELAGEAA
jgi:hypothetical protein